MNPRSGAGVLIAAWLAAGAAWAGETNGHAAAGLPAPAHQSEGEAEAKSSGCVSCHVRTEQPTMHASPGVVLGCADCHGGDPRVSAPGGAEIGSPEYDALKAQAHVPPRHPEAWALAPANPPQTYTLLNREAPEFVRFVNPGDLRVARESCGACHLEIIERVERSLMATGAMFWGGASYNNGILPWKRYVLGEAYTAEGEPAKIASRAPPTAEMAERGVIPQLLPLPAWETVAPADNFRIF